MTRLAFIHMKCCASKRQHDSFVEEKRDVTGLSEVCHIASQLQAIDADRLSFKVEAKTKETILLYF